MHGREKVVYGCFPCFLSLYFVNLAIKKHNLGFDTIIISTRPIYIHKRKLEGLDGVKWFVRKYGWRYLMYQIVLSSAFPFNLFGARIKSFKKLAKKHGIQLIYTSNFHSDEVMQELGNRKESVFVSFGLDQILRKKFINKFKWAVNIHPSKLPDFRGPDPIFYFMLSGLKKMGTTMHLLNEEIDEGHIVFQESAEKSNSDTHLGLLKKSVVNGCKLVSKFLEEYDTIDPLDQSNMSVTYPYKSIPEKPDLSEFKKQHAYFKTSDFYKEVF